MAQWGQGQTGRLTRLRLTLQSTAQPGTPAANKWTGACGEYAPEIDKSKVKAQLNLNRRIENGIPDLLSSEYWFKNGEYWNLCDEPCGHRCGQGGTSVAWRAASCVLLAGSHWETSLPYRGIYQTTQRSEPAAKDLQSQWRDLWKEEGLCTVSSKQQI